MLWTRSATRLLTTYKSMCVQVVLAMKRGWHNRRPLQYAAARAVLWLLNDLPALVELLLFPENTSRPVSVCYC